MSAQCTPRNSPLNRGRHRSPSVVLINDSASIVVDAMASLDSQPPARRRHTAKVGESRPVTPQSSGSLTDRRAFGQPTSVNTLAARGRAQDKRQATRGASGGGGTGPSRRAASATSKRTIRASESPSPPRLDERAIFGHHAEKPRQPFARPPAMGAFPRGKVRHATRPPSAPVRDRPAAAVRQATVEPRGEVASRTYDYTYHVHPLYPRAVNHLHHHHQPHPHAQEYASRSAPHLSTPASAVTTTTATATTVTGAKVPHHASAHKVQPRTVGQLFDRRDSLIERYAAVTVAGAGAGGGGGSRTHGHAERPGGGGEDSDSNSWSSDDENIPEPLKSLQGATGQELFLRRAPEYDPAHPINTDSEKPFLSSMLPRTSAGLASVASSAAGGPGGDPANTGNPLFQYLSSYKMGQDAGAAPTNNAMPTVLPTTANTPATFDASASPLHSAMKQTNPTTNPDALTNSLLLQPPPPPPPPSLPQTASNTAPSLPPPPPPPPLPDSSAPAMTPKTVHFADEVHPLPPPPPPPPLPTSTAPIPPPPPQPPVQPLALSTLEASASMPGASASASASASTVPPPPGGPPLTPEEKAQLEAETAELKLLNEMAAADARVTARDRARNGSLSAPPPGSLEELLGATMASAPFISGGHGGIGGARSRGAGNLYGWQPPPANVLLPSVYTNEWHVPSSAEERLEAEAARVAAMTLIESEKQWQRRPGGVARRAHSAPRSPHRRQEIAHLVRSQQQAQQGSASEVDYQACFEDILHPEAVTQRLYATMEVQARSATVSALQAGDGANNAGAFMLQDALPASATDGAGEGGADGVAYRHGPHHNAYASYSTLATQAVVLRNAVSLLSCEHLSKDVGTEKAVTEASAQGGSAIQSLLSTRAGQHHHNNKDSNANSFISPSVPRGPTQSTVIANSVFRSVPPPGETFCELSYPAKVLLSAILYVRALGGLPTLLRVQPLTTFSPVMDKGNCLELVFLNPAKAIEEQARRAAEQEAEAQRQRIRVMQQQQQQQQYDASFTEPNSPLLLNRSRGRSAPSTPGLPRRPSNVEMQLLSTLNSHTQQRRRRSSSPLKPGQATAPAEVDSINFGPSMSFSGDVTPVPLLQTPQRDAPFADIPYVQEDVSDGPGSVLLPTSTSFLAAAARAGAQSSAEDSAGSLSAPFVSPPPPQPSILRRMGSERWMAPRVDTATGQASRRGLRRSSSVVAVNSNADGGEEDADDSTGPGGAMASGSGSRSGNSLTSGKAGVNSTMTADKEQQWRSAVSAALQNGKPPSIWSPTAAAAASASAGRAGVLSQGSAPQPALKPPSTPTRKGESHVDPIEDELCVVVRAVLANKSTVHRFGTAEVVHVLPPLPRTDESMAEKVTRVGGGIGDLQANSTAAGLLSESNPLMKFLAVADTASVAERRQVEANRKQILREQMKRQSARGPVVINEDGKPTAEDYGDLVVALLLSGGASQLSGILPDSMELESLRYKIFSLQGYSAKDPFGINRTRNQQANEAALAKELAAGPGGQSSGMALAGSPSFAAWNRTRSIASMTSLFGGANTSGVSAGRSRHTATAATTLANVSPNASFSASESAMPGRSASVESVLRKHFGPVSNAGALAGAGGDGGDRQRVRAEAERLQRCHQQFPLYRASSVSESTLQAYHHQEMTKRAAARAGGQPTRATTRAASDGDATSESKNRELREAEQELLRFRPLRLDCFYSELVDAVQFALDLQVRQTKEKVMQAFHM